MNRSEDKSKILLRKFISCGIVLPFVVLVFVIPIIRMHIPVMHHEEIQKVLIKTQVFEDTFHLIKVLILYAAAGMLFFVFIVKKQTQQGFPRVFLFLIPYTAMILMSVFFSEYRISALFGIIDQYEGGLTQLSYIVILIFSYYLLDTKWSILFIIKTMLLASVIVAAVGIYEWVQAYPHLLQEMSSTIGNSNYVGTYGAILLPLAIVLVAIEQNRIRKLLYLLLLYGSALFLLLASMSRAGFVASIVIVPLLVFLLRKEGKRQYLWVLATIIYSSVLFISVNAVTKGLLIDEWKSMNPFQHQSVQKDRLNFEQIRIEDTTAFISTNRWELRITIKDEAFHFEDGKGESVSVENKDGAVFHFPENPYRNMWGAMIHTEAYYWLFLDIEGKDIEFVVSDGKMKVVGYNGRLTDIVPVKAYNLGLPESFASGRGYIWSRTLPLIKNRLLLGYGPDTFVYVFPQNDIVGKLNYGAIWVILSKPHSWYLQIAVGSGIVALVSILVIIAWYFITMAWSLLRGTGAQNKQNQIACAILLSVLGYCIAGVFNDSVVSVSPIFWMLLGIGVRYARIKPICYTIEKEEIK